MSEDNEMNLPELSGDSATCKVENRNGEWHNLSSKPITRIKCIIPQKIVESVRELQSCVDAKLGGSNEFGGYVKWHWTNEGDIMIDDYEIPEQVVGGATVDFKSKPSPGYTGVFHKHPTGCRNFSSVDYTYINANNELSILFEGGTFVTGIVNIALPNKTTRLQVTLTIVCTHAQKSRVDVSMIHSLSTFRRRTVTEVVKMPPRHLIQELSVGIGPIDDFIED